MKKVYSVVHGKIEEYELLKETNCFYKINFNGNKDRISKDGNSLPQRLGGRSIATTDILKAATAAQEQINIIEKHIEKEQLDLCEAKDSLKLFHIEHTTL